METQSDYKHELTNQLEDLVTFVKKPRVDQNNSDLDIMIADCQHLINKSRGYCLDEQEENECSG